MKKKILTLLVVLIGMMCAPSIVHAATTTLVDEWGRVEAGDYTGYEFEVPDDGELEIELVGLDDEGIGEELEAFYGSYGEYNISLSNMAKDETPDGYDTFWDVDGETGFDDKSYAVDVEAGDYIIWLEEISGYYDFDYIVKVKHTPNKTETVVKPTSITLNKTSISLKKGATYQLTAKKNPSNAEGKITWTTSNKNVATVSSTGKVTAKGVGTATITAKCGTVSKKCTVKVTAVKPTAITLNKTSLSLKKGGTYQLTAKKNPSNAEGKITWTTSNKSVATVSSTGKVTAKGVGKATITAKCGNVSKKCTVTVAPIVKNTSISSVASNKNGQMIVKWKKGSSITGYQIRYSKNSNMNSPKTTTIKKASTTSKTITGLTKGKKYYVQIRTYKKVGDKSYYSDWGSKKTVTIMNASLKKTKIEVNKGKTKTLVVNNKAGKKVTWKSSNAKIATVNSKGVVTGKKVGSCTITATVGSQKLTCKVKVIPKGAVSELEWTAQDIMDVMEAFEDAAYYAGSMDDSMDLYMDGYGSVCQKNAVEYLFDCREELVEIKVIAEKKDTVNLKEGGTLLSCVKSAISECDDMLDVCYDVYPSSFTSKTKYTSAYTDLYGKILNVQSAIASIDF